MNAADAEEYTLRLGQVVAGGWRLIALGKKLGVPSALGLTVDEWVKGRLGGYVRMSTAERIPASVELVKTEGMTTDDAGKILGVDKSTVSRDVAKATAEATKGAKSNEQSADAVANATPLDVVAGLAADDAVRAEVGRDERREQIRAERVDRINAANAGNTPLEDVRPAPVVYADPPWEYEHVKTENRAVENHYPTMTLEAICALQIPATADAALFLWATSPKLAEALRVLESWGFTYRTCMVWVKDKIGMGYYARQQHELLLIATRGSIPVPEPAHRPPSVVTAPRGAHSEKPIVFYDVIERMYPEFEKIELFQRGPTPREGWRIWGNQSAIPI